MNLNNIEDPVIKTLVRKIQEARDDLKEAVAQGNLPDHARYKEMCGVIKGYEEVLEMLQEVAAIYLLDEES